METTKIVSPNQPYISIADCDSYEQQQEEANRASTAQSLTFSLIFDPLVYGLPCIVRGMLKIYRGQVSTVHFLG